MPISKARHTQFIADATAAIQEVAARHGVSVSVIPASLGRDQFSFRVDVLTLGARPDREARYEQHAAALHLPALGASIRLGDSTYKIMGMNLRPKNCIELSRLPDGKEFSCSIAMVVASQGKRALPLEEFVAEVNRLLREQADAINAKPGAIFGAEHNPLPAIMLRVYHEQGFSPAETIARLDGEAAAEARAEAAAS